MEFDWINPSFEVGNPLGPRDIEESFEDPFAIRLLPDTGRLNLQARYFNLGKSAAGVGVFAVYRTNGKVFRVIFARPFTEAEEYFYQRKLKLTLEA